MEVAYQQYFPDLLDVDIEIAGEIQALIDAVASRSRDLGDPESHPVVTSRLGTESASPDTADERDALMHRGRR